METTVEERTTFERSMAALTIVGGALLVGATGNAMLRATPWGIGFPIALGTLLLVTLALGRRLERPFEGEGGWLAIPALLFAAAVAWRASGTLAFFCVMAVLVLLGLAAPRLRSGSVRIATLATYVILEMFSFFFAALGTIVLAGQEIAWRAIPRGARAGRMLAVLRGLVLAVPLLLIFGGLFMAADPVFRQIVVDLFDIDVERLMSNFIFTMVLAWAAAGYLFLILSPPESTQREEQVPLPSLLALGTIEVTILFGTINLLFAAFVLVQARYLFGGAETVVSSLNLTYSEYARRGFFELATVSALVLPLLLGAAWLIPGEDRRATRLYRVLAALLIALLYIVMISALQRMRLYLQLFGLTETRLYVTAFMGWQAILFLWFGWTVLRDRPRHFVFGALVAGMVVLGGVVLINPDHFIATNNLRRGAAGQEIDLDYLLSLSPDAVPPIVANLNLLDSEEQCRAASRLVELYGPDWVRDWRTWNWGRERAARAVSSQLDLLEPIANCPDWRSSLPPDSVGRLTTRS